MGLKDRLQKTQFKALGDDDFPPVISIDGRRFAFQRELKHGFAVAVGVYGAGDESVVVKLHRQASLFGIPLKWAGKIAARYESAVLRHCCDIKGVPGWRRAGRKTAVAHDYIPGHSLNQDEPVGDLFFMRLLDILDAIHKRGVAYVDLEKPANVLKGDDGLPYLIDFQVAFYWPENLPLSNCSLINLIRKWLQRCDRYHAYKHLLRIRPDLLTEAQYCDVMCKPWQVRVANALLIPWQMARKMVKK